jgi:hypothetical protein
MAMRSVWKGSITFSLLSIGIKLYTAIEVNDDLRLEAFPCRDAKQFLAGSLSESRHFRVLILRSVLKLEAYIAGSANWKIRLAESSKLVQPTLAVGAARPSKEHFRIPDLCVANGKRRLGRGLLFRP